MDEDEQVSGPSYTLKIQGEGLSFEHKIDAAKLASVMALAFGVAAPAATVRQASGVASGGAPTGSLGSGERLSLREFLDEVEAKKIPEKIVAISAYIERQEGQTLFTRDDVKSRFRTAGEAQPGNFPRDFGVAISSGWVAEDHANRGSFYVTKKGHQVVDARFSSDVAKIQRRSSRRRRGNRNAESDSE